MKFGKNELFDCKGQLYIIPDTHGELNKIQSLWNKLRPLLKKEDHLVFLGDYLGMYSLNNISSLKLLQEIKNFHDSTFFIKGNHDDSFISWLNSQLRENFLDKKTLEQEVLSLGYPSFNKEIMKKILDEQEITFLNNLIPYYESKDLILTHAPICPSTVRFHSIEEGLLENLSYDLMWTFVQEENIPVIGVNKWLICGHQNQNKLRNKPSIYLESKRIFLDCGVGYNKEANLYCFKFPQKTFFSHN